MATKELNVTAIDFGYSAIRVSVFKESENEEEASLDIVQNDLGNSFTPNIVAFDKSKVVIGEDAVLNKCDDENVIFGIKKLIGRMNDEKLREELKRLPFTVDVSNEKIKVIVSSECEKNVYSPEEITALMFSAVKNNVEPCLKTGEYPVAISVPVNFRNSQRQSMIDAANISGINDVTLVNETTAIASLHLWQQLKSDAHSSGNKNLLVVCIGAASTSISVMSCNNEGLEVKEHFGFEFGGNDIDTCFQSYVLNLFDEKSLTVVQKKDLLTQCQ
ncbi:hypothetical protein B4U80_12031, partial [Leptotrombidium deliense]